MRVLVTGGAGYIGSVTTELLLDEGHAVVHQSRDVRAQGVEVDADTSANLDHDRFHGFSVSGDGSHQAGCRPAKSRPRVFLTP